MVNVLNQSTNPAPAQPQQAQTNQQPPAPSTPKASKQSKKFNFNPRTKKKLQLIIGAVVLVVIIIGAGAGYYLSQQQQEIRQKAVANCCWADGVCDLSSTTHECDNIPPSPGDKCVKSEVGEPGDPGHRIICLAQITEPTAGPSPTPTRRIPTIVQEVTGCIWCGEHPESGSNPDLGCIKNYGQDISCDGISKPEGECKYEETSDSCYFEEASTASPTPTITASPSPTSGAGGGTPSPTPDPREDVCLATMDDDGSWRSWRNTCQDRCYLISDPDNYDCSDVGIDIWSCDCGTDRCWNGTRCVDNPTGPSSTPTVTLTPTATAAPGECGASCTTNADCSSDLCVNNTICALAEYQDACAADPTQANCCQPQPSATATVGPTATIPAGMTPDPTDPANQDEQTYTNNTTVDCNDYCANDSDCTNVSHICHNNQCRLDSNPDDENCQTSSGGSYVTVNQSTYDGYVSARSTTTQPTIPEELPSTGWEDLGKYVKIGLGVLGIGALLLLMI
ncbi:MAG: hypothetical protein GF390_02765 [Candidatus Pacebacteria bacterium]|nr:hypothetical protein [Candidatus Paceibacterota bacterium]